MSIRIERVSALEILDSRGRPTLQVTIALAGGVVGVASVPSGVSTGSLEAVELRDADASRYAGQGVRRACASVTTEIAGAITGHAWSSLAEVDEALIELDGTPAKARLGANATVGVSMAAARAFAASAGVPLWRSLVDDGAEPRLPVPHFNVLNGGAHARTLLAFQEFMIAPLGASSLPEAVRAGAEVYAALRRQLDAEYLGIGLGDEGGFAPDLKTPDLALQFLEAAILRAGYAVGRDGIAIALDPAASQFRTADGRYHPGATAVDARGVIDLYESLTDRFGIWSIEDGLGEDDWEGWRLLTERLGRRLQLVGDDIFVTNPALIERGIGAGVANAALIKVNQIGTVTEAREAVRRCRAGGFAQMVSHRSGETNDAFVADLAVGLGCGQLKAGAPARGERTAKYNRLLEIAASDPHLPYGLSA